VSLPVLWASGNHEPSTTPPFDAARFADPATEWEVEIGFGKGRYLRRAAAERSDRQFLGVEMVSEYFRDVARLARRDRLDNLTVVRAEALYLLAAVLPRGFARAAHVYFPDPWPKTRHRRRRLFDPTTVDLVVGLLRPGATLFFATDFVRYGEVVRELLESYPGLDVERRETDWSDGPRTNYEAKYVREGRSFVRLTATRRAVGIAPHPRGERELAMAHGWDGSDGSDDSDGSDRADFDAADLAVGVQDPRTEE
jgi:tRNA (guanine-N7-)-methyltransferase